MRLQRMTVFLFLGMVAAIATAACHSARRGEPLAGPMVMANSDIARGQRVFMRHCQPCHPGGDAGLGPALNNKPLPAFLIRTQVRAGMGTMPSFSESRVSDSDLDLLTQYVAAQRARKKPD